MDIELARSIWDQYVNQDPAEFLENSKADIEENGYSEAIYNYVADLPRIFDDPNLADQKGQIEVRKAMFAVLDPIWYEKE